MLEELFIIKPFLFKLNISKKASLQAMMQLQINFSGINGHVCLNQENRTSKCYRYTERRDDTGK